MGPPQILICGESGGNGRICQLAERFGSHDPFAERDRPLIYWITVFLEEMLLILLDFFVKSATFGRNSKEISYFSCVFQIFLVSLRRIFKS